MKGNNFLVLQEEAEQNYNTQNQDKDGANSDVWKTLSYIRFLGQLVELYLPKVFQTLLASINIKEK